MAGAAVRRSFFVCGGERLGGREKKDREEGASAPVERAAAKRGRRKAVDAEAARGSLVEFRRAYLAGAKDVEAAGFHRRWSDILLHGQRHFAVEAFRESGKTQIVIRANLMHALAFPQEHRGYIVVICATQRLAGKKLHEAGRMLAADLRREEDARKLSAGVERVVESSGYALEVRYADGAAVRVEAYGKGAALRGLSWGNKRPDLVIIDDPQDTEDARSESITENDWEWFLSDVLFLGQESRIFLIGNNLGERCIMERVLADPESLGFDAERVPVLCGGAEGANKESAWPEKYPTAAVLEEMERFTRLGRKDVWWREKMCTALAPESQRFRREYFRYFTGGLSTAGMNVYTAVDLAVSKREGADRTAVVTVGVNPDGHWFVLDIDAGRYDPTQTMDAIFHAVARWRPMEVGIEAVAYQAVLAHFLQKEMPRRNSFFVIRPLKAELRKELRIDAMQPRFSTGTVWLRQGAPWLPLVEGELLAYPRGLHDDAIDALAYIEQMAVVPDAADTGYVADERVPIHTWGRKG